MTESQRNRINAVIEEGYRFDLGDYISRGFTRFRKSGGCSFSSSWSSGCWSVWVFWCFL
ncbi:MAG: hypothetical protein NXI25_11530 [bacterium]|nr:hypothetical protein [bacterium]